MDKVEKQIAQMVDAIEQIGERMEGLEKATHQIIRAIKILSDHLGKSSQS